MINYKTKLVVFLVTVALMLPNFLGASALEEKQDSSAFLSFDEVMELAKKQAPAVKAYEELVALWNVDGKVIYPDTFGGYYISEDNILVVNLVDGDESTKKEILGALSEDAAVTIDCCDISLSELRQINSTIWSKRKDLHIVSSGIDQESCRVKVEFEPDTNISVVQKIYNSIDWSHVSASYADIMPSMKAVSYNPGKLLYNSTLASSSSIVGTLGWYGTYKFDSITERPCFVTAGHVFTHFIGNSNNICIQGNTIIRTSNYDYNHFYLVDQMGWVPGTGQPTGDGMDGDYAFIMHNTSSYIFDTQSAVLTQRNTLQRTSSNTVTITGYLGDGNEIGLEPENLMVMKCFGSGAAACEYGYIDDTEYSYEYNVQHDSVTGLYKIRGNRSGVPLSHGGDSGGAFYHLNSNGTAIIVGIISGGETIPQGQTPPTRYMYDYITPFSTLVDAGFTPYLG